MKKLFPLVSLLMLISTVFVACDKDDDTPGLVGTWEMSKVVITKMDNKDVNFEVTNEMLNPQKKLKITFNADGTIKFNSFPAKWELLENDTKLQITYPAIGDSKARTTTLNISLQNNSFAITNDDSEYTNLDKKDDGEFSFTKFDEKFKTNIKDKKYIEVSSEEHFARQ